MRNLAFVIWMIGWPAGYSFSEYLGYLRGKSYSEGVEVLNALIFVIIWVAIGILLYENKP